MLSVREHGNGHEVPNYLSRRADVGDIHLDRAYAGDGGEELHGHGDAHERYCCGPTPEAWEKIEKRMLKVNDCRVLISLRVAR